MYHEHEAGRRHVRELVQLGGEAGAFAEVERRRLVEAADGFVPLLRGHILKEDRILYPMALRVLTGPELDAIDEQFAAFAARVEGDGSMDRLRALADRLVGFFRPDPARMEAAAHLLPCG
jgi:hemerythrin-like domain-containing protein